MAHEVFRLKAKLMDEPQLVTAVAFEHYLGYLDDRNSGIYDAAISMSKLTGKKEKDEYVNVENGYAVLSIDGPLTYQPTLFQMLCGGMSYATLESQVESAIAQGAHTVILDSDSPGGEAYGCFETARNIRAMADKANVKLVAYVDGIAASACYGLVAAAHEIVANPDAELGSIGVVTRLTNSNKKEKNEGKSTTYVYAGNSKIPFDKDGEFREEFIADLQSKVDRLYTKFVSHVAELRGISEEAVKQTEAKMFVAEEALALGLADKIQTKEEFYESLSNNNGGSMAVNKSRLTKMEAEQEVNTEMSQEMLAALEQRLADLEAKNAELSAQNLEAAKLLEEQKAKAAAEAAEAERLRVAAIHAQYEELASTLSFVNMDKAEFANAMMAVADLGDAGEAVLSALGDAQKAIEAFACTTKGADLEAPVELMGGKSATLAAKLKEKYKTQ